MSDSHSNLAELNRAHFDKHAHDYTKEQWQQKAVEQIIRGIRARVDWLGVDWTQDGGAKILDYACGPGTVSQALSPHGTTFHGIDISPPMIHLYNTRIPALLTTSPHSSAAGYVADLVSPHPHPNPDPTSKSNPPDPEYDVDGAGDLDMTNYDLVAVGMALHHFADPGLAVRRLAGRVRPGGGVLCVVDAVKAEEHTHGHGHGHAAPKEWQGAATRIVNAAHRHFTEDEVKEMFEAAGLVEFKYEVFEEVMRMVDEAGTEHEMRAFFARGRRAA